jgi:hypothetical protein
MEVSFIIGGFTPGKKPHFTLNRRMGGPRASLDIWTAEKPLAPARIWMLDGPASSLVTIPTMPPQLIEGSLIITYIFVVHY